MLRKMQQFAYEKLLTVTTALWPMTDCNIVFSHLLGLGAIADEL